MHGRARLAALIVGLFAVLPSAAAAAPIPPGTYDVQLSNATVVIGSLLGPMTMNVPATFPVDIGSAPVTTPLNASVPDVPINVSVAGYAVTGTIKTTITSASTTIDPIAQSASVDIDFYTGFDMAASLLGTVTNGSCSYGSAGQPISLHLTTAQGKAWDATTGAFQLADKTFALPAPACSPALLGSLIGLITGTTSSGNLSALIDGLATRRPDVPGSGGTTNNTTNTTNSQTTNTTAGSGTTTSPTGTTTVPKAKQCVIPKLVGKTLKSAKRALKKAGCKVKVKRAKSKKKKDRVVKQRYKAGRKLPAGTTVTLTVSRGTTKARKQRSR